MSLASPKASHPAIQPALPPIHLSADLLDTVELAVPPPPADAPLAWQSPSRAHLIAAIAAYTPTDAAQACLAAQIVTCRLVAEDTRWRSSAPDLPKPLATSLRRTAVRLMRAATQLERPLRQWQETVARDAGAPVPDRLDLAALMALWGQAPPLAHPTESPIQPEPAPEATLAPAQAARTPSRRRTGPASCPPGSRLPAPTDQPAPGPLA